MFSCWIISLLCCEQEEPLSCLPFVASSQPSFEGFILKVFFFSKGYVRAIFLLNSHSTTVYSLCGIRKQYLFCNLTVTLSQGRNKMSGKASETVSDQC